VFVDTQAFTTGTLDILAGYLDHGMVDVQGVDYTKAIYLLQSNLCDKAVNLALMTHLQQGLPRTFLSHDDMMKGLDECLLATDYGQSALYQKRLLYHVPFLPLQRTEVKGCVCAHLTHYRNMGIKQRKWHNLEWTDSLQNWLLDQWRMFGPFAINGCKQLRDLVRTQVQSKLERRNKQDAKCVGIRSSLASMKDDGFSQGLKGMGKLFLPKCWRLHRSDVVITVENGEVVLMDSLHAPPA